MSNQLDEQRQKAIAAIVHHLSRLKDEITLADLMLDDFCRELFKLPQRPTTNRCYGWLLLTEETSTGRVISQQGINLIKRWEGFRANAYMCPAGKWTIGYGHTLGVNPGQIISQEEAEILLRRDIKYFEDAVNSLVKVDVSQAQFDALVSLTFNCGVAALAKSTMLKYLNTGRYELAANEFDKWVYANKRRMSGLVFRRAEEKALFLS